jgi:hypothetical protein
MLFMRTVVRVLIRKPRPNLFPRGLPQTFSADNGPLFCPPPSRASSRSAPITERLFHYLSARDLSPPSISEANCQPNQSHALDSDSWPLDLYLIGDDGERFRPRLKPVLDDFPRTIIGWELIRPTN